LGKNSHVPAPGLFSAATGIISNVNDMARYAVALEGSELVNEESKTLMFTPTRSLKGEDLPYGLGWFVQNYLGQEIVWHYGQADSYASLFVRIPKAKLTLIVLANSGAMSDAFRLLDGNAMRSLLALDFLKDVVLRDRSTEPSLRNQFEVDEEIDQALVRIYLGERDQALSYARMAFASGILPSPSDLTTLYLLARLRDRSLNQTTEAIGMELIQRHPRLSPALFYLAIYYQTHGEPEKAIPLFERIAQIRPPLLHWTTSSALLNLGRWYADRNPSEARKYLQRVVDSGDNSSGAVDEAKEMLRRVPKK
jgi:tetratricopeptide (TPR) repeat protein